MSMLCAGGARAVCRGALRLRDAGPGVRFAAGRGALCVLGLGGEAPLPAGGRRRRGLVPAARLHLGLHQVPAAHARAHPGDLSGGGRRAQPLRRRAGAAVGGPGAAVLRRAEEATAHEHRRLLQPLAYAEPREDGSPQVHAHGAGLHSQRQSPQRKLLWYLYW